MSCKYLHVVNAITVNSSASTVVLTFSKPVTSLSDEEKFCIKIPCGVAIPTGVDGYAIQITYADGVIPLWNKYGNLATVSDIANGKTYKGYYGATSSHVIAKLPITYNCGCNNVL